MWNLVFVCPTHHLDGIHRGFVRVTGRAPDDLEFALGVRSDGTALDRFHGERRIA